MKILVIEDEPGLQLGLKDMLEDEGYQVQVTDRARQALADLDQIDPCLILLDLSLPDLDGTSFLEKMRKSKPDLPVLILTARASESDVLYGFKLGADDYVTKPFSPRILLARIEALVKRSANAPIEAEEGEVRLGNLSLDFEQYRADRGGQAIRLTTREFEILKFLHGNLEVPTSRYDILDEVWGMDTDAGPRTVDTHIAAIRKKIEPNPENPIFIISQRGVGYKLTNPDV